MSCTSPGNHYQRQDWLTAQGNILKRRFGFCNMYICYFIKLYPFNGNIPHAAYIMQTVFFLLKRQSKCTAVSMTALWMHFDHFRLCRRYSIYILSCRHINPGGRYFAFAVDDIPGGLVSFEIGSSKTNMALK